MKPIFTKGQLITWKEDRGFGFIKPNNGGKDVFLHISVLPTTSRRPKVGDTILYQRVTTPKGKVRAAKASIQGVVPRASKTNQQKLRQRASSQPKRGEYLDKIVGLLVLAGIVLVTTKLRSSNSPAPITASPKPIAANSQPDCNIKGNISINTGKKYYHLPGMEDYDITTIRQEYGEKWFCSEGEAIRNGWTKAPS
ncbi:MAG: cold shock domain-containing protein [Cyanobacteria bacterium P01_A01_bin.137]